MAVGTGMEAVLFCPQARGPKGKNLSGPLVRLSDQLVSSIENGHCGHKRFVPVTFPSPSALQHGQKRTKPAPRRMAPAACLTRVAAESALFFITSRTNALAFAICAMR